MTADNKANEAPERIWIASPVEFKSLISKSGPAFDNDIEYRRVDPPASKASIRSAIAELSAAYKVETVESTLAALREMFPILTVTVNVYANWIPDRRDKDFVTIRMFGASPSTSHTREFNAPTLSEAMAQVRKFKESQQ